MQVAGLISVLEVGGEGKSSGRVMYSRWVYSVSAMHLPTPETQNTEHRTQATGEGKKKEAPTVKLPPIIISFHISSNLLLHPSIHPFIQPTHEHHKHRPRIVNHARLLSFHPRFKLRVKCASQGAHTEYGVQTETERQTRLTFVAPSPTSHLGTLAHAVAVANPPEPRAPAARARAGAT